MRTLLPCTSECEQARGIHWHSENGQNTFEADGIAGWLARQALAGNTIVINPAPPREHNNLTDGHLTPRQNGPDEQGPLTGAAS